MLNGRYKEAYGTSDSDADSDDDMMPDGYEYDNLLDGTSAGDKYSDFDGDGNPNVHEYFNGTLAGDTLNPDPYCGEGGYCFGESGWLPTNGVIDGTDLTQVKNYLRSAGAAVDYTGVIPPNGDSADLDGSSMVDGGDLTLYKLLLSGQCSGDLTGAATQMNKTLPPGSSITGGGTIEVEVLSSPATNDNPRSGYGVIFWIHSSSTGAGTIYGGDGDTLGFRYDVTGDILSGGKARVYLHVLSGGTIQVNTRIPAEPAKFLPEVPPSGNYEMEFTATQ